MESNLDELFTIDGAVKIDREYQFAGREDLLKSTYVDLTKHRFNTVLYGEGGVGKTSLGWQLYAGLTGDYRLFKKRNIQVQAPSQDIRCIWLTCAPFMETITDVVLALLTESSPESLTAAFPDVFQNAAEVDRVSRTNRMKVNSKSDKRGEDSGIQPSNDELAAFLTIKSLLGRATAPQKTQLIIFLDEFDQVGESNRIGVLLKALNSVSFVIIGISQTVESLIGHHPSVGRKLTNYQVPLFRQENVEWFFNSIEKASKGTILFDKPFRKLVTEKSSGYPWLVQQFGYFSALRAEGGKREKNQPIKVSIAHYHEMIRDYLATRPTGVKFEPSVYSEVARPIMATLARTEQGRLGSSDLINQLTNRLQPYFEDGVRELEKAGVVYRVGREVRISHPLTRVLLSNSLDEGHFKV